MTRRQKATLVFEGSRSAGLVEWSTMGAADSRMILVHNLNLLKDSLHLAQGFLDIEVVRVVFDQSIGAEEWLEFLTAMPTGFRGDVVFVTRQDQAFLSAVGRSDERVMYKLEGEDIRFYLEVCGIMAQHEMTFPYQSVAFASVEALAV